MVPSRFQSPVEPVASSVTVVTDPVDTWTPSVSVETNFEMAIRRPERAARALGARERLRVETAERAHPQHAPSRGIGIHKHEAKAVW